MTTFDFRDGRGPVPAHQHANGGGWVANTATVAIPAYIGPDAQVFGLTFVGPYAQVYGNARVSGKVRLIAGRAVATWRGKRPSFTEIDNGDGSTTLYLDADFAAPHEHISSPFCSECGERNA